MSYGQNPFKVGEMVTLREDSVLHHRAVRDPVITLQRMLGPCVITSVCPDNEYIRFWGENAGWSWQNFESCLPPSFNLDEYL